RGFSSRSFCSWSRSQVRRATAGDALAALRESPSLPLRRDRATAGDALAALRESPSLPLPMNFGDAIRGLTAGETVRFTDGCAAFERVETPEDGLGPVFNAASCAACHNAGGTGGGSALVETRFGTMTNGAFDP